jgi:hypothetical protein
VAENPNKINNIVEGDSRNIIEFEKIYSDAIELFIEKKIISFLGEDKASIEKV